MLTFPREERLKEKLLIAQLFAKGKPVSDTPVRLLWLVTEPHAGSRMKILFSVPRKKVRRAVDRNRIKRIMREVYRSQRAELSAHFKDTEKTLILGLIFNGNPAFSVPELESKIILTLRRLVALNVKTD